MSAARTPTIDGRTQVYFVLGDPIDQVRAPALFNPVLAREQLAAVLVPAQVHAADLPAWLDGVMRMGNLGGLWVTVPHKTALTAAVPHLSARAQLAGAVNAVRRRADGALEGDLFDGLGLLRALAHFGLPYADRRVWLVGAGGAAAAIAAALVCAEQPPAELAMSELQRARAQALVERLAPHTTTRLRVLDTPDPTGFDLIVHASPLGMRLDDPLPFDPAHMEPGAALFDILMKNQPTPLVRAVRALGRRAEPGFEMLVQQAPLYLDFFGYASAAQRVAADLAPLRAAIDDRCNCATSVDTPISTP